MFVYVYALVYGFLSFFFVVSLSLFLLPSPSVFIVLYKRRRAATIFSPSFIQLTNVYTHAEAYSHSLSTHISSIYIHQVHTHKVHTSCTHAHHYYYYFQSVKLSSRFCIFFLMSIVANKKKGIQIKV